MRKNKSELMTWVQMIGGGTMMLAGIFAGFYFGLYWAFIGGIVDVIDALRADTLQALSLAIGVAKIVFAGVIGWVSFAVLFLVGLMLAKSAAE